ncbi:MAG: metallophosphoesterase [Bacteroidia bacterium]|nr:metallophosphoesterase [Bacteroidia bacterium]
MKRIMVFFPTLFLGMIFLKKDASCWDNQQNNSAVIKIAEEQYDGPYVQYIDRSILVNYVLQNKRGKKVKVETVGLSKKSNLILNIATDEPGKFFQVRLKEQLQNENTEFTNVSRQLVLSDIEGNFGGFRKLLQGTGVIDTSFNWTFGNGHLVLVGDFFDRGEQVTEVLWLIYSLEEKAKAARGYVHFILGNHEIMNMSGDFRYVQPKYLESAALLNMKYESLYNENTELGRWLRTKNIMENIDSILFIHGGISAVVNRMNLSAATIDQMARPWYADTTYQYPDPKIDTIFTDLGPFWYRGYYTRSNRITSEQIDSTLSLFDVKHIVTGHTIVADTISVWYNGRILNTDVHHAGGKSEALLIEENKFYRVDPEGNKVLLQL